MKITKEEVLNNLDQVKNYIQEIECDKNVKEKKKINITIKNRFTGSIIWESEKTTYKEAVEEAVESYADLSEANLSYANLSEANLSKANLSKANLSKANLSYANLSEANLSYANLSEANLSKANLSYADLSYADLSGTLYYMGNGNRNFEALCKAIKTIKHQDGKFEDLTK